MKQLISIALIVFKQLKRFECRGNFTYDYTNSRQSKYFFIDIFPMGDKFGIAADLDQFNIGNLTRYLGIQII